MIDREKVVSVLQKRFPGASAQDVAAAANAIVGLPPDFEPIGSTELEAFACAVEREHYSIDDVMEGGIRIYRRRPIA
jgi:hypothetical protein